MLNFLSRYLKLTLIIGLLFSGISQIAYADADLSCNGTGCDIGDFYGGGIVYYIAPNTNGSHGLIAASHDQAIESKWWDAQNIISNPNNYYDSAAKEYTDWRLPTKFELNELYLQRQVVGGFASGSYWSSSEHDANNAWDKIFTNGNQDVDNKNSTLSVRAVRDF